MPGGGDYAVATVFAQPDAGHVAEQFEAIATMLGRTHPKVEAMMHAAREDLLAFTGFPTSHWKKGSRPATGRRSGRPTPWSA